MTAEIPDWFTRLRIEAEQLDTKLERLKGFCGTEEYRKLPESQRQILVAQAMAMAGYLHCLDMRIALGYE